jgi:hypothetical protein
MKKKLKIEILRNSEAMETITRLVAHHNSEEVNITLQEIETFLKVRGAVYPTLRNSKGYIGDDGKMIITDDGLEANIILSYE